VTRALADAADQASQEATHHDVLTGLPTRFPFVQDVKQALQRSTGHRTAIAVLLLNMDRMKHLNESWGHEVGNEILIRTARRIRSSLRPGDTVARLEGDDFVVLLEENKDTSFPCRLAERILGVVDAPLDIAGQRVFVSASLGIAFGTDPHDSPEDIISNAELAVRRAKVEGRGQYAVFDPALDGLHQRRVTSVNQA
jgi:diguanylate cyclase (GGDEF)-like protein